MPERRCASGLFASSGIIGVGNSANIAALLFPALLSRTARRG
jgi:hypothetical protein